MAPLVHLFPIISTTISHAISHAIIDGPTVLVAGVAAGSGYAIARRAMRDHP
jgi:hypothetical protein